jgi:hypothetical protein
MKRYDGSTSSIRVETESSRWTLGWESSWSRSSYDGMYSKEVEADASIWKNFCS